MESTAEPNAESARPTVGNFPSIIKDSRRNSKRRTRFCGKKTARNPQIAQRRDLKRLRCKSQSDEFTARIGDGGATLKGRRPSRRPPSDCRSLPSPFADSVFAPSRIAVKRFFERRRSQRQARFHPFFPRANRVKKEVATLAKHGVAILRKNVDDRPDSTRRLDDRRNRYKNET